ncbi:MAG: sigma-54 interaction domain-containing protein [Planctomycetota bacterium]
MHVRVALFVAEVARFRALLESLGAQVVPARDVEPVPERLEGDDVDLVVADAERLGRKPAVSIAALRALTARPDVVAIVERDGTEDRARLLAARAVAVLATRWSDSALREALDAILARRREELVGRQRAQPFVRAHRLADFASASPAMAKLLATARRVVSSSSTVVLLGETGVGKEWLARSLHEEGPRAAGPFVAVNCGALPEQLLESEMFGHERGAFTGAVRAHRGHFEMAHGGTVFLDEVGDMPLHLQVKLLRVLQERRVQRLGAERATEVDVRVLAATHRDPEALRAAGALREDLWYRLAVVTLRVPPLRERLEDLAVLAQGWLERQAATLGREATSFSPEALEALLAYRWPGNLRELVNVVERAVLLSSGPVVHAADLPDDIVRAALPGTPLQGPAAVLRHAPAGDIPFAKARRTVLEQFERDYLVALLERSGGRVGEASLRSGLPPRTLYDLLRRHGLRGEDYRFRIPASRP